MSMSEARDRYRSIYTDFNTLVTHGISVSTAIAGREAAHDRAYYGDRIFSKLLCHAITLKRIAPTGVFPLPVGTAELWDISSACAVARALVEAYDALAYIAIDEVSGSEREFRILLWQLHSEERRQEMLRLIGSSHVLEISQNVTELRQKVTSHDFFKNTDTGLKKKSRNGKTPPFHLSHAERNKRAGVNHQYYTAAMMFLSAHVHTHPFSTHQLMEFRAGDPESLRLMSAPIQYALGFLSKGIEGMSLVFASIVPTPAKQASEILNAWIEVVTSGISRGD